MTVAAPDHRWSGWPGAWCLDCGTEDQNEAALLDCADPEHSLDPMAGVCLTDHNGPCPEPNSHRHDPYHHLDAPPAPA